ncbi:MAG: efflux RND transporter periplasmic adaptor subunit [Sulfuricella sp.]|jgi:multidrug efflux pump subunit AcrA (membrane-fusion protein)|nr:efflux RND transporter periplasmic adaptor subunit [Sulfuricella sp.]
MTKKTIAAMVALLVVGGLLGWSLGRGGDDNRHASAARVTSEQQAAQTATSEVVQQSLVSRTKMGGYIEPRQIVRLSAQGVGRVVYIAGNEGMPVMAGQVVIGLDEDRLMADYRSAWAHLSGEMSGIQNAQVQLYNKLNGPATSPMGGPAYDAYDRSTVPFYNMMQQVMPLFGGAPMQPQSAQQHSYPVHSQARSDYERQQAGVVGAQAKIDAIEAQLRDRRSIAPFPAVILTKHVNLGDTVQPGQVLIDLANVNELDLRLEIPARLIPELAPNTLVPVVLDGNVTVDAMVDQIYPAANSTQHTVTVKLALPPGVPAAPGMYAVALLPEPHAPGEVISAPVIPMSALVYRGSLPSVFAVGADGKAELRVIRIGERQGDRVVVLSGLKAGDRVVKAPTESMRSGSSL